MQDEIERITDLSTDVPGNNLDDLGQRAVSEYPTARKAQSEIAGLREDI